MFQRGRSISQHQRSFLLHIWTTTRTFHCGDQSLSLLFVFALANYMEVWLYVWIFKLTRTFLWWSLRWLFWGLLHILFLSLTRTLVLSGDLIYIDNLKKDLLHVWFLVRVVEFILSGDFCCKDGRVYPPCFNLNAGNEVPWEGYSSLARHQIF